MALITWLDVSGIALTYTFYPVPTGMSGLTGLRINCYGPGGRGAKAGGGGGAFATKDVSVSGGEATVLYTGVPGGYGTPTACYFSVSGSQVCIAAPGGNASGTTPGSGGLASASTGDTKFSGGDGGSQNVATLGGIDYGYGGGGGGGARAVIAGSAGSVLEGGNFCGGRGGIYLPQGVSVPPNPGFYAGGGGGSPGGQGYSSGSGAYGRVLVYFIVT